MNFEAFVKSGGMQKSVERSTLAAAARANALGLPVAVPAKQLPVPMACLPSKEVPARSRLVIEA